MELGRSGEPASLTRQDRCTVTLLQFHHEQSQSASRTRHTP